MNKDIKFFICPMSKNIVDAVINFNNPKIGLLPSRRQIECNGGYVNDWNTETFTQYVKSKSNIVIERDHAGKNQGELDEYVSYNVDTKFFDIIHIDPWKTSKNINEGIKETILNIKYINKLNKKIKFEVGTEESLRKIEPDELEYILLKLKDKLTHSQFENIIYVAIQSGVDLDLFNSKNDGNFNIVRFREMIEICNRHGKKSKEHNGDFLKDEEIKLRFENGLDSLNIGPEFAQIETKILLNHMNDSQIEEFYDICYNSKKWVKWIKKDSDIKNKESLIMACGHYNFNNINLKNDQKEKINQVVINEVKNKLNKLLSYV